MIGVTDNVDSSFSAILKCTKGNYTDAVIYLYFNRTGPLKNELTPSALILCNMGDCMKKQYNVEDILQCRFSSESH